MVKGRRATVETVDFRHSTSFFGRIPAVRKIAESIIIQSIEDLWNHKEREESISFFRDSGFSICASMAGMGMYEQVALLDFVNGVVRGRRQHSSLGTGSLEGLCPGDL